MRTFLYLAFCSVAAAVLLCLGLLAATTEPGPPPGLGAGGYAFPAVALGFLAGLVFAAGWVRAGRPS